MKKNSWLKLSTLIVIFGIFSCSGNSKKNKEIEWKLLNKITLENISGISYIFMWKYNNSYIIADNLDYRLECFDKNGKLIFFSGKKGKAPGEFNRISAAFLNNNNVYILDDKLRRLSIFKIVDKKFQLTSIHKIDYYPVSIAVDNGYIWITSLVLGKGYKLHRYDLNFDNEKKYLPIETNNTKEAINTFARILVKDNFLYMANVCTFIINLYKIEESNIKLLTTLNIKEKSNITIKNTSPDRKGVSIQGLGPIYISGNYFIYTYDGSIVKNRYDIYNKNLNKFLGSIKINSKNFISSVYFANKMKYMYYIDADTLYEAERITPLPYDN